MTRTSASATKADRGRRRLAVEDRRTELIEACLRLIGTRSWDEVTMADVAVAAGASKPLLYHYFSTKTDLYVAAVRWAAEGLGEATRPDPALPAPARLQQALRAHLDWIDENADTYRAVLHGGMSGHPAVRQIVEESRKEVTKRLAEGFGIPKPTPAQRVAIRGWVGFLDAACIEWLTTRDLSKAALVRLLASSLTEGPLQAAGAGPPARA